jgi:hypothetical protein
MNHGQSAAASAFFSGLLDFKQLQFSRIFTKTRFIYRTLGKG